MTLTTGVITPALISAPLVVALVTLTAVVITPALMSAPLVVALVTDGSASWIKSGSKNPSTTALSSYQLVGTKVGSNAPRRDVAKLTGGVITPALTSAPLVVALVTLAAGMITPALTSAPLTVLLKTPSRLIKSGS